MIRHSRCKSSKIQNYTHTYKCLMFMSGCTSYWGSAVISIISPSEVQCWPSAGLHYSHMLHWSSNTGQTFILYTNTNIQHLVLICTYSHLELSFFSKLMQRIIKLPFNTLFFVTNSTLQRTNIFSVHFSPFLGDSVVLCDKNLAQCSKNTIAGSLRGEGATTGFR